MRNLSIFVTSSALLLLFACTPTLNWREVRLESADGSALKAQLPCKPDAATRKQQLAGIQVNLSMMGCVAGEATFTLSRIPLSDPLTAPKVLAAWQAFALSSLNAPPATVRGINIAGASAWPPTAGVTLAGAATQADIAWFARQSATGLTLYQAAMYVKAPVKPISNEAVTTFFESLQIQ